MTSHLNQRRRKKNLQRPTKSYVILIQPLFSPSSLLFMHVLQLRWPICFLNLSAMLMPQGLFTDHSLCLVHFSFLHPHINTSLSLGICSSVTFSSRPYINSLFNMTVSTHFSIPYYPPLFNFFFTSFIHMWYAIYLVICFAFPIRMYTPLEQGFYFSLLFCWFIPNTQKNGWHITVIQQIFSESWWLTEWIND